MGWQSKGVFKIDSTGEQGTAGISEDLVLEADSDAGWTTHISCGATAVAFSLAREGGAMDYEQAWYMSERPYLLG